MIERCGDRQRKCDGIEKWPLHPFIESLPVMLQISLFLLAWGLCQHMWTINTTVAYTLVALTGLGALLYVLIVISGLSSYACPFQTPVSTGLRRPLEKLLQIPALRRPLKKLLWITASVFAQCRLELSRTRRVWNRGLRSFIPCQPPPPISAEDTPSPPLTLSDDTPSPPPTPSDDTQERFEPWLMPENLAKIRRENADDARCVSWILKNITDPEALDAAVRLAGTVQWFKDGTDVEPPYDVIVSNFLKCFDSDRNVYPGSIDRAYYTGRAMLWIQSLARYISPEVGDRFPYVPGWYTGPVSCINPDLADLLHIGRKVLAGRYTTSWFPGDQTLGRPQSIDPGHTPSHLQWISNLLLHEARVDETTRYRIQHYVSGRDKAISLNTILNHLLVWCICFDSPIDEEVLRVQDKS